VRSLEAVVMVFLVRLAVSYLYTHILLERLTALMNQFVRLLDGW